MTNLKIHPLALVQSESIGEGTQIWQFAIVLAGAVIGKGCNINCHTFIEDDVVLGDRVTVKSGIYLWNGVRIADDVFLGPNVTFVNDKYPRSKKYPEKFQPVIIEKFVSVGAGSTILGGITIGEYALVAAGSLVTKDVPSYSLVKGSPAKVVGRVDALGEVIERF